MTPFPFRMQKADAWSLPEADAVCITTNGFVSARGLAAVGMGVAKAAKDRYPQLGKWMAQKLHINGHCVQVVCKVVADPYLVSFPVKPAFVVSNGQNVVSFKQVEYPAGTWVPGFYAKASLALIERSLQELVHLTELMQWQHVVLPRPGCGAGELRWEDMAVLLARYLDHRFILVHQGRD